MPPARVRHNLNGYAEIRRAPKVQKELERRAAKIAAAGNRQTGDDGYRTSSQQGRGKGSKGRWRTTVITVTHKARKHNAANNFLVKELGNG
jgi:hypothetical protein